ncbi:carboxylating nicotinate-nucleotide diphosphorylase [Paremcibacter congregatus]|uniref:carboxylating nicotinate-nucleotide diphosphorylase n=1 Tax=Paremcibacter congregatus TaxID=2043170 RepID=UPI003A8CDC97
MTECPLFKEEMRQFIKNALDEDVGRGDLTTLATIPADLNLSAAMITREPIVVAGMFLAIEVIKTCDPAAQVEIVAGDGLEVMAGSTLLKITGNAQKLLTAERSALNILQHLSGIATLTRAYVRRIEHTDCRLLDTRKTIPGYRKLAKYASRMGGAMNHRMRLDDGVLIKDNHIARIGGVKAAIDAARAYDIKASTIGLTVECDTLEQAAEAVQAGADRLLLDNMSLEQLCHAVARYKGQVALEASGGVTLETIGDIADTGVDFISVGRITQSAPAVDIGLDYLD